MTGIMQDLLFSVRALSKARAFTLTAVLTLAVWGYVGQQNRDVG